MSERVLTMQGGPLEGGKVRPKISIYFEHDGWSDEQFAEALRAGRRDEVNHESRKPLTLRAIRAVVNVDGWEIGRELVNTDGVLKLRGHTWRRAGESEWHNSAADGQRPNRQQIRKATLEPYRELIDGMLAEGRSMYPDWTEQMNEWALTRVGSGRGRPRQFDSAGLDKQSDEDNDTWVADRLGGVNWQTPAKRRLRDRQAQLAESPWALRFDESVERCRIGPTRDREPINPDGLGSSASTFGGPSARDQRH